MLLTTLMSKSVQTVKIDDNLALIRDIFNAKSFHHLVVVEHKKVVGIISDRDYLKIISPRLGTPVEKSKDLAVLNVKAHQIMHRHVITLNEKASIAELISTFHLSKVSCIPIVDDNHYLTGIISWRDVIRALFLKMEKDNKTQA